MSQLQVTGEAKIRDIQGPVVANAGVITALDGAANQYVRGDGTLASFPTSGGGGSSVSYYLNGSVNQGTFAGSTYYEMGEDAITGTGTNFSTSTDGLLAQFITDAGVPDVTEIPSGNWNVEFFMGVSASSGALASFYVEIYKWDGSTFTLIATNAATPEFLTNTTTVDAYFTSVAMPTTTLAVTDRLAIRIYANVASKTVTLYTEDNRLCQVVTTFSKGILSVNNLTDQSQYLTTGTSGTNFNIASSGDTHTFNLPVASATNTGKLSSTDWTTFNNKQNAITDPITGTGASGQIAYFNSGTSITSEAAFNYDASTNRLGVNTSVPNATIGANAPTDSGYSLLLKNDNANYNGIGFGVSSVYGNIIETLKLGSALSRNLTLFNQSGYLSLTEDGNLGLGILTPSTGLDIYNGTSAYLWLHTATSGLGASNGVRLALFNTNGANLRNFEGSFSITAEGDFSVITLGAENFRINSADGSIYQSKVSDAMLKTVSGVITAAVAGTDYVSPSSLSGYVPTSRTLTINGTAYDLSANRSWSVGTISGGGSSGRVAYYDGASSITSEAGFTYDSSTNRLGVNTTVPNATIGANAGTDSGYSLLLKNADTNYNGIGFGTDSTYGNLISTEKLGTATAKNITILNQSGFVSLTEGGNLGLNILNPAVAGAGIDIYSSTSAGLRFHTATSGTTVSDGAGINFSSANNLGITNYEAGAIDIVTNGNSGVYINQLGYVGINGATPSSELTVNGNAAISGLTTGQIVFPTTGGLLIGSSSLFWDNTNGRLAVGTNNTSTGRKLTIYSASADTHLAILGAAPSVRFADNFTATYSTLFGMATASNNYVTGAVAGDFVITYNSSNNLIFGNSNTSLEKMRINSSGNLLINTTNDNGAKLNVNGVIYGTRARLNNSYDNSSVSLNVGGQTYMDSRTSRLYQTYNLSSMSNYMHIYDPYSTVNANGGFSIGASSSIITLPSTSIIHFDGVNNRVGIGTTAPSAALSVVGAATFSGALSGTDISLTSSNFDILKWQKTSGTASNVYSLSADSTGCYISDVTNTKVLLYLTENTGAATFSSSVTATTGLTVGSLGSGSDAVITLATNASGSPRTIYYKASNATINFTGTGGTDLMTLTNGGNVGIGTSSPARLLHVAAASGTNAFARVEGGSGGYGGFLELMSNSVGSGTDSAGRVDFYMTSSNRIASIDAKRSVGGANYGNLIFSVADNSTSPTEAMRITNVRNVLIGTQTDNGYKLTVAGQSIFTNTVSSVVTQRTGSDGQILTFYKDGTLVGSISTNTYSLPSDLNFKKNISNLELGLNLISKLRAVSYNHKIDDDGAALSTGFIAQELEESLTELGVKQNKYYFLQNTPNEDKSQSQYWLDYTKIIPILVNAIQEQQAQIEELKQLINNK